MSPPNSSMMLRYAVPLIAAVTTVVVVSRYFNKTYPLKKTKLKNLTLKSWKETKYPQWVSILGTVFNVSKDPFFDSSNDGIYSDWLYHDVTFVLLQSAEFITHDDKSPDIAYDQQVHWDSFATVNDENKSMKKDIIQQWYKQFLTRYEVLGYITDCFSDKEWKTMRQSIDDANNNRDTSRTTCPLGFGSRLNVQKSKKGLEEWDEASLAKYTVLFQGQRYDIRNSAIFESDGMFHHMVGHDITHAIASALFQPEQLDVKPLHNYSYEEQVRLERFRKILLESCEVISMPNSEVIADLHDRIDKGVGYAIELLKAQGMPKTYNVNTPCPRTGLTPLHRAIELNNIELVQLLVDNGADTTATTDLYDNMTPLELSRHFQRKEIEVYLSQVANLNSSK